MTMKKLKTVDTFTALSESQYQVLQVVEKLHSYGVLLYGQGEETEGFTDLRGLGMELKDLATKLRQVWRALDQASLSSNRK